MRCSRTSHKKCIAQSSLVQFSVFETRSVSTNISLELSRHLFTKTSSYFPYTTYCVLVAKIGEKDGVERNKENETDIPPTFFPSFECMRGDLRERVNSSMFGTTGQLLKSRLLCASSATPY